MTSSSQDVPSGSSRRPVRLLDLMAVVVTAASADDGATASWVLGLLDRGRFPRLEVVSAD